MNNKLEICSVIKIIVVLIVFFFSIQVSNGQRSKVKNKTDTLNDLPTVIFYSYGMIGWGYTDKYIACEDSIQKEYQFTYIRVAGCVMRR